MLMFFDIELNKGIEEIRVNWDNLHNELVRMNQDDIDVSLFSR